MNSFREELLFEILSQPAAPFRERHVITAIVNALSNGNVPHFIDPIGNVVVGVANEKEYRALLGQKSDEPLRIYIAHTDHPGFHGVRWLDSKRLEFKWHGGSPLENLAGASVWLATRDGSLPWGVVESASLLPSGRAIERGVVELRDEVISKKTPAHDIYGGFSFRAPVWKEGDVVYTKAADDLVGAFCVVSLALDLFAASAKSAPRAKKTRTAEARGKLPKNHPPFLGLLTRAEEVGFIGAIGHFELGWLQKRRRPVLCVSLETSRTLPGALIGKGPVVRLGDRSSVFEVGALSIFKELAKKALPDAHQVRIMDGGTCEATAAIAYGLPSVGISVPLGNYHNQSFEGGPDSRGPNAPAPEFVHAQDIQGLITLCHALLTPKQPWSDPFASKRKAFKKELAGYRALLKSGP